MSSFSRAVVDYWRVSFGGMPIPTSNGTLSLTVNSTLNEPRRVMILERADSETRVVLTPALAERSGLDQGCDIISIEKLRGRLADGGLTLHDPDYLFYLPDHAVPGGMPDSKAPPRRLSDTDRAAFDRFQADASEQDLSDSYVELDHWAVFGCFDGDRLVSAASAFPWDGTSIVDLGVLTLPDVRSKGYARAVVQAIGQLARANGYEPQYRCQIDNVASIALAKAAGFELFAKWEVIDSDRFDPAS